MNFSKLIPAVQLSIRAALSAAIAVAIAQLLQLQDPLYALIGAVIVTDLSPLKTRQLALRRLIGTLLGATVGAALSQLLPPGPSAIGFSILVAMFLSHLSHLQDAASVTGYVCGILMLDHSDHPWSYALYRVIETVLGIGVAGLVSLFPKLIGAEKPDKRDS